MHKVKATGVLALALVVGSAVAASTAWSSSQRGGAAGKSARSITVYTALAQAALLDLGQPGFSLGDQDVFTDNVLTRRNGARVGTDGGVCTVVRVTNAAKRSGMDQCLITFSLKDGQITTQVLQPSGQFAGTSTGAITGGTGRYRNARGTYVVQFLGPAAANVTFSIQ